MLTKREVVRAQTELGIGADDDLVMLFNVLGDKTRFCIIKLLIKRKKLCVTDIASITNSSISATSHQLRILEMTNIVEKERKGQTMCYLLREDHQFVKVLKRLIR